MYILLILNSLIILFILRKILLKSSGKNNLELIAFDRDRTNLLKGALCIGIILCHTSMYAGDQMPNGGRVASMAYPTVSVFFFISGYGLMTSLKAKGQEYLKGFLTKRMKSLLVPLIVLNIINVIAYIVLGKDLPDLNELKFQFLYMSPFLIFSWFVYAMIVLYLLFYFLFRFLNNKYVSVLLIFEAVIFFITYSYADNVFTMYRCTVLVFPIGLLYALFEEKIKKVMMNKESCVAIFVSIVILNAAFFITMRKIDVMEWPDLPMGYVIVTMNSLVYVLCSYFIEIKGLFRSVFKFLGNISYEIYLVHGIIFLDYRFGNYNICLQFIYVYSAVIISAYFINKLDRFLVR